MVTEAEFNRFTIAVQDFEKAAEFADEALRIPANSLSYEALVFASIVCYYRPFTPNEKDKNILATSKLSIENFLPLTDEESKLHDYCKILRNEALAHSEYKHNPTKFKPETCVIVSKPFSLFAAAPDMAQLAALSRKLVSHCHNKRANYVRNNVP